MATADRRQSISLFFGFGKQQIKAESSPDAYPKLRRKLQKVTKQVDAEVEDDMSSGLVPAPPARNGSVQMVKVPGDDSFLSTKYDAQRPSTRDGSSLLASSDKAPRDDKHSRRNSVSRFFRSSSVIGLPGSTTRRSASRSCSTVTIAPQPEAVTSTIDNTQGRKSYTPAEPPSPVSPTVAENRAAAELQTQNRAQRTAQSAMQARTLQLLDAHEKASAQEWVNRHSTVVLAEGGPALPEKAPSRPYQRFHRPYRSQPHNTYPPISTQSTSRRSMSMTVLPFSPASSSASEASSISPASPASAVFSASSASFSCTSTSVFSAVQSNHNLPLSPCESSFSYTNPPDEYAAPASPYSQQHREKVIPELSYLSRPNGHDPRMPDSPVSTSSVTSSSRIRRRVKTPVYAIGQLESNIRIDEATSRELARLTQMNRNALHIQTPPHSPVRSAATVDNRAAAELDLLQSKSSIECIAEEYRALLASRNSHYSDAHSEVSVNNYEDAAPAALRSKNSVKHSNNGSNSAQPPPLVPLRNREFRSAHPSSPQPDNLSLQICMDLLTRELSSAVAHRSSPEAAAAASQRAARRRQLQQSSGKTTGGRSHAHTLASPVSTASLSQPPSSTASALQILVMIEAYERLRDHLIADSPSRASRRGRSGEDDIYDREIPAMFNLWLGTLHRIHDSLTGPTDDESDGSDETSNSEYDSAEN